MVSPPLPTPVAPWWPVLSVTRDGSRGRGYEEKVPLELVGGVWPEPWCAARRAPDAATASCVVRPPSKLTGLR